MSEGRTLDLLLINLSLNLLLIAMRSVFQIYSYHHVITFMTYRTTFYSRRDRRGRDRWYLDLPASFTNKANSHDITKIVFKVALNTISPYLRRMNSALEKLDCICYSP